MADDLDDDGTMQLTSGVTMSAEESAVLWERQQRYDELVDYFGLPDNRASLDALALHERIMRIMRGEESDPR